MMIYSFISHIWVPSKVALSTVVAYSVTGVIRGVGYAQGFAGFELLGANIDIAGWMGIEIDVVQRCDGIRK